MEELERTSQGESPETETALPEAPTSASAPEANVETEAGEVEAVGAGPVDQPVEGAEPTSGTDGPPETGAEAPHADPADQPFERVESADAVAGEAPAIDAMPEEAVETEAAGAGVITVDELMRSVDELSIRAPQEDVQLKAVLEAIIYVAEEPLTAAQIAASLQEPPERIRGLMAQLIEEFEQPGHGVCIREIAGGYKMATKPEHHDAVRNFVKSLKPPLKLSLPALETLAVIAYKQPVTGPEVMEIRGVQGGGVMKTLLDRKLIAASGRKNVIGKPILYKTTKEFLIQFGLKDLSELPTLKEFEELKRLAFDGDTPTLAEPEAIPAEDTEDLLESSAPTAGAPDSDHVEPQVEPAATPAASEEA